MKPKIAAAVALLTTLLLAAEPALAAPPPAGRECSRSSTGRHGGTVRIKARYSMKGVLLGRTAEWIPPQDENLILGLRIDYDQPTEAGIGAPSAVSAWASASVPSFAGAVMEFDADGTVVRRPLTNLSYMPAGFTGSSYHSEMSWGTATMTGRTGKFEYSLELLPLVESMRRILVRLHHRGYVPMQIQVDLSAREERDKLFRKTWPKIIEERHFWKRCAAFW